ncbi:DEAD/DEAH box helicase family protein [Enterocloster bolteae]|uniref:DEAD/DEAH box helicase family protein n=1 Tax=Enterocloster bolteae TaxID=208479 RepID=UPI0034C2D575
MAVDLKPHNLETYNKVKEIFKTKNRACCVQPTGSGKSYLALKLFEENPSARKLVLEPQHYIREQLQAKVTEDMGTVQFITYSKLAKMSDEDIAALEPDIIVLDEFHRAGAKEWGGKGVQRLLESYPESKVLGLSATPIRYLDSGRNMAEELFDGAMANNMSLAEAIVQRILPLPRYISGLYCLDGEVESINKKIEQSYNNPEEKKTLLKQVREMKKQLDKSNGVSSIFRKYILEPNGKYIVFCKDIKHLNQMKPMLEQWFADAGFKDVRTYVVHSKNENKDAEFKKFKEDDGDGIRLCLVVSMLNEGVHVDGIDGVFMLRNTISAGLFFQQIGRAISCNSKGIPLILDLVANAQSVTECNLKTDIEREIQKERERNKGFSSEGLDVEAFFIMDEVLDVISAFKGIEGRLVDSWDIYIKALEQYKEREGDCLVPGKHVEVIEGGMKVKLGYWVARIRLIKDNNLLTNEKIIKLNKMGFCWNQKKEPFFTFIKYLTDYKECNHHCDIKNSESFNGYPIGKKYSNYVYRYKHNMLDKSDCMMLESVLGIVKDRYELRHERNCKLANECISEKNIISKKIVNIKVLIYTNG